MKVTLRKWEPFVASMTDSRATSLAEVGQRNPSFGVSHIRPSAIPSIFGIGGIDLLTKGDVKLGAVKSGVYLLSGRVDGLPWQRKLFLK